MPWTEQYLHPVLALTLSFKPFPNRTLSRSAARLVIGPRLVEQRAIRGGAAIPDENAVGLHGCSKLLIVDGIVVTAVSSDSWAVPTAVRGRLCEIFSGASRHDPHPWEVIDPEDRRVVTANSNLDSAKIQFAETDKQVRGGRTAVFSDEEANL